METTAPATSCGCHTACAASAPDLRPESVNRALRLEYLTVGWNVVEGIVAVTAALIAGSVAILGFGIDSFVECASALVMIWRLRAERDHRMSGERLEAIEHRARRLVAGSLFLLAAYITFDAAQTLWTGDKPAFSPVGVVLLSLSIAVMLWLARAKRRLAHELGSEALEADAFQTTACWWLSVAALVGVGLNGLLGWWWADADKASELRILVLGSGAIRPPPPEPPPRTEAAAPDLASGCSTAASTGLISVQRAELRIEPRSRMRRGPSAPSTGHRAAHFFVNCSASCPGGGGVGARGGGRGPRPWRARSSAMASRVVAASTKRIRPPQEGQVVTSTWNTCRRSQAHGLRGGFGSSSPSYSACSKSWSWRPSPGPGRGGVGTTSRRREA